MEVNEQFINDLRNGDKRAISRAISIVEDGSAGSTELLKDIFKYTGKAHRIGITGPPGAGKSSITNCLAKMLIDSGHKVGIIAVDPTSPFTGGALLGDRIRMQEVGLLPEVFIRSMATRGSLGGLSKSVVEACDILDASGKDFILIETVGVGQSELDIAQTCDTTVVVLVPESGDAVQAMKAGLMEIADIFVVNKSDREGAAGVATTIRNIIHLKPPSEDNWEIKVLNTASIKNEGITELLEEIMRHTNHLEESGFLRKKRTSNLVKKINELVNDRLQTTFWNSAHTEDLKKNLPSIYERNNDPYTYVDNLLKT
ncbi:MAG: methylmalonyl Co-A mutase-associated GTPase MeaB [Ignavibacteriae bacterium]|nr:methylmalonyl Co-A mutase-associated GTPase MeaB [Ignavibacteriota bacterium]MCB9242824.1 methylmalonyl Co-A mutase-associated GTPase MeaB [Ignavibacteriales bacterium]